MGYIDSKSATLKCPKCKNEETIWAYERGSQYGASWGSFEKSKFFDVTIHSTDNVGPVVSGAICLDCKVMANVS